MTIKIGVRHRFVELAGSLKVKVTLTQTCQLYQCLKTNLILCDVVIVKAHVFVIDQVNMRHQVVARIAKEKARETKTKGLPEVVL